MGSRELFDRLNIRELLRSVYEKLLFLGGMMYLCPTCDGVQERGGWPLAHTSAIS